MSGNTPLITPTPKRSSVEIAYTDGTVDTSEMDGTLYFADQTIQYNFLCPIPKIQNGVILSTEEMNAICEQKTEEVHNWLYSGPAILTDYGLPRDLMNAECQSVNESKTTSSSYWIIKFEASFIADYNIPDTTPIDNYDYTGGRYIVYNGFASYAVGLKMVGSTPVSALNPKTKSMEWKHKNGSLRLNHGRNGRTSGVDSSFYQDRTITYKFVKFYPKNDNSCEMNKKIQTDLERICMWLFLHPNQGFTSINGNITYGGADLALVDSAWMYPDFDPSSELAADCEFLPSARITNIAAEKSVYADKWALSLELTFTTHPSFFGGYVNFATAHPTVSFSIWKHYAEIQTTLDDDRIPMIEFDSAIYVGYSKTEFLITQDWTTYTASNLGITMNFENEIPVYVHPSIDDSLYKVMITVPYYVAITCNDATKYYYVSVEHGSNTEEFDEYVKFIDGEGITIYDIHENACASILMSKGVLIDNVLHFIIDGTISLIPMNEDGFDNESGFTAAELEASEIFIQIPVTCYYLQAITGDDILEQYGLYPSIQAHVPSNYYIQQQKVIDFSSEEPTFGYLDVPYVFINSSSQLAPKKFNHPSWYNESNNFPVYLRIPVENNEGNQYILCDSDKPEGGDIQWL
jgi:hypothetical protein